MASPPLLGRGQSLKKPYGDTRSGGQRSVLVRPGFESLADTINPVREQIDRGVVGGLATQMDRYPILKPYANALAGRLGETAGVARGGVHAAQGLGRLAVLEARLLSPALDRALSPKIRVEDQLWGAASQATQNAARYAQEVASDPKRLGSDLVRAAHRARVALDPGATATGVTSADELRRRFQLGANRGEVYFDVATTVAGGPGARQLGRSLDRALVKPVTAEHYINQGFSKPLADHLAKPYRGMGSHFTPRSTTTPQPKNFMNSEFNVLAPEGITQGGMYGLHYIVDPRFNVARLPPRLRAGTDPKVWNGGGLGLKKLGPLSRYAVGMPGPLKARVGGSLLAGGAAAHGVKRDEPR